MIAKHLINKTIKKLNVDADKLFDELAIKNQESLKEEESLKSLKKKL